MRDSGAQAEPQTAVFGAERRAEAPTFLHFSPLEPAGQWANKCVQVCASVHCERQ